MRDTIKLCGKYSIEVYYSKTQGTVVIATDRDTKSDRRVLTGKDADKFINRINECFK